MLERWLPLRQGHGFLARHAFYPVAAASALAVGALCARVYATRRITFVFLLWNLALAWAPYVFALALRAVRARRPTARAVPVLLGAAWLAFFPNGPYLVTDFIHLYARPGVPLWYDLGMLCLFAWSGCLLGAASLAIVHDLVRARAGRVAGGAFALASLGLAGFGIYLGRFVRLNSWDVVFHPRRVAAAVLPGVTDTRALVFSAMFAAIGLVVALPFITASSRRASRD